MKLGIIGTGLIVQEFLPQLVKLDGLEVVALQGVPAEKEVVEQLCRDNGIAQAVYSFEDLIALDLDTVYVAVPNFLHFTFCQQALAAGLNVIVEKPMTSNVQEAEKLKQLAEEKSLFLFEAITTLHFTGYQKIRDWLPQLGRVKMVHCNYSQYSRRYDAFKQGRVLSAFDPAKAGGALMDLNLYNLHFVMGLFGMPETYKYYANVECGIDTNGTLVMTYPDFLVTCTAAKDCSAPAHFIIQGTDGYISTQYSPNLLGRVTLHRNDGSEETFDDGMAMSRLIPEFSFFIDCINRRDLTTCLKFLENSLAVSKVQTEARLEAGILFPSDQ